MCPIYKSGSVRPFVCGSQPRTSEIVHQIFSIFWVNLESHKMKKSTYSFLTFYKNLMPWKNLVLELWPNQNKDSLNSNISQSS